MKVALAGNPNSGKTSVFNQLTGLNQQVGNYPGVTVDKKSGKLKGHPDITIIDLPGSYSIYPNSSDERIVSDILGDRDHKDFPDAIAVVVDATNLERNLLLYTQIHDLNIPVILVVNMIDLTKNSGMMLDLEKLKELFTPHEVIQVSARKGEGIDHLIKSISAVNGSINSHKPIVDGEFDDGKIDLGAGAELAKRAEERYKVIRQRLKFCYNDIFPSRNRKADEILTHRIWGYAIFLGILFLIFQAIYAWAEWPMDLIDGIFLSMSQWTKNLLPDGPFTDLLAEGVIPGIGGVVIFIPQIVLLFSFIFILEETGYMARVVFIMDRLMRPFGLNGRSVVPLISGVACAIPAVMATRTIDNWKERLITIMVTPLMSCSARLPVYTLLIVLVIPETSIGIFNLQGLVLMGLYLLGLVAALVAALGFKFIIRSKQRSFLIMELPRYKMPRWNNLSVTIFEKTKVFVLEAGRVILAISIVLWVLASYGPGDRIENAAASIDPSEYSTTDQYEKAVSSASLSNSYIGIMGNAIEPVIKPLGYNWQIGIALITSFAAREVFVGSMATIYSVGEDFEADSSLLNRMKNEINPDTNEKVYNLASGLSLMVFYAFAMQCMSTLAIVLRETKKWKWPLIQFAYMTVFAYIFAFITYQLLS